ncbi:F-box only protein 22-like [Antedon mediterranea]|uniref:F-box only protein 22-like n=1 Tax=Antedon mediterranea TaxID=105859 RepID=UPI003AF474F1
MDVLGEENDIIVREQEEELLHQQESNIRYVMTELHEFLKRLFKKLPAQSLLNCSRVCKRWKSVAELILKSRENCITWAQYNYHIASGSSPSPAVVPHSLGYFGLDLHNCLKETWSVPASCLFFSEFQTADKFHGSPVTDKKKSSVTIQKHIKAALPPSCDILSVTVPGTISTTRNLANCAESEGEGGAVAILFPKMEGVQIYKVSIQNHRGIWEQSGVERHQNVKCILTMTSNTSMSTSPAGERLQNTFFRDGQTPVIAGAVIDYSLSDTTDSTECIVFAGDRVNAASILLDENVDTEEHVIRELTQLKNAGLSETNSIGFMFACIGRGSEFFQDWDVESKAFRKIFPRTPLFGVFGNGEIGCTNLPKSKWKKVPQMTHGYTTIICLISFG